MSIDFLLPIASARVHSGISGGEFRPQAGAGHVAAGVRRMASGFEQSFLVGDRETDMAAAAARN